MTKLTTHALDIYSGKPGAGIKVELYYFNNNKREKKKTLTLNLDGRTEEPLLEGADFLNGKYELIFFISIISQIYISCYLLITQYCI